MQRAVKFKVTVSNIFNLASTLVLFLIYFGHVSITNLKFYIHKHLCTSCIHVSNIDNILSVHLAVIFVLSSELCQ